jgi:hypothetical protein
MAKEYKKLLIEKKGVTVEKEPEILKTDVKNDSVFTPETHKQTEEIRYVLVENSPLRKVLKEEQEAEIPDFSGMSYPQKFEALMKHHGIEKISELSDEEKKEFFNTLDEIHVSKDEKSGDVEPNEVNVGDESVSIEIPGSEIEEEIGEEDMEELKEAIRTIHTVLARSPLNEEESVQVPADAEAEVKVEGDKIVVEIPVESPKEEVEEDEAEVIEEAVSVIARILRTRR